jgi:hypothetical protein
MEPVFSSSLTELPLADFFYSSLSLFIAVFISLCLNLVVFLITEHESDSDSYDGKVEDISVDESSSNTSMSEAEITDTDLATSVDIQAR